MEEGQEEEVFESEEMEDDNLDLEGLITRLEVTPRGELLAGFRNLGVVYYPWLHWFVTPTLGRNTDSGEEAKKRDEKKEKIQKKIESDPELSKFKHKLKHKYWWTYAIKCPPSFKKKLPTKIVKDEPVSEFIMGHFTPQARWRLSPPGRYAELNERLLYGLKRQKQIRRQIDEFNNRMSEYASGGQLTRALNDLDEAFDEYDGGNWDEVLKKASRKKSLEKIDPELLESRKGFADQIRITNQRMAGEGGLKYLRESNKKREHELSLERKSWKHLVKTRTPGAEELLNKKWMFLDIEIPYWRRDNAQITWVGVTYVENGKTKREIHTIHDVGADEVNGFKICRYKDANELVEKLTTQINKENPDFISSYNTRFDLIKLRETDSGFGVGDRDTNPLMAVTQKFFERIKIHDRFVIDFLRWQKIARAFDINAKLEMAAGFEKAINYDELESLEDITFKGGEEGKKAGFESASYLASDVKHLTDLFFNPDFRKNFQDVVWMSEHFGVGIERLLHSANCINDVQEKGYFGNLGIYRDAVAPNFRTTDSNNQKAKARTHFKESFLEIIAEKDEKRGLFTGVSKVFIPYGDFFRDLLEKRFPEAREFFEYKDRFKDDKRRLFFLEQYGKEFARWMIEDYGFDLKDMKKLEQMLEYKKIEDDFEEAYEEFRGKLKKESEWGVHHLDEANLSAKAVAKHRSPKMDEFIETHQKKIIDSYIKACRKEKRQINLNKTPEEIALDAFTKFANQRSKIKRRGRSIIGNYGVFPDSEFFNPEKYRNPEDIFVIYDVLKSRLDGIKKFLKDNRLEVICQEGSYLYLTGGAEKLKQRECPVVLVDEIPRLYNADNAYYKKFDFFSHMKLKEEPDFHLNVFEMQTFREMLDNLLSGRNDKAMQVYRNALERIKTGKITPKDLVFFNKSANRYSAYSEEAAPELFRSDGTKSEPEREYDGKMYFVEHEKFAVGDIKTSKSGRYFVDEEGTRVYIKRPDEIIPNIKIYEKRFVQRAKEILAPIAPTLGKRRKTEEDINQGRLELNLG